MKTALIYFAGPDSEVYVCESCLKKRISELEPKWTDEKPTQYGWYWYKEDRWLRARVVGVFFDPRLKGLQVFQTGIEKVFRNIGLIRRILGLIGHAVSSCPTSAFGVDGGSNV